MDLDLKGLWVLLSLAGFVLLVIWMTRGKGKPKRPDGTDPNKPSSVAKPAS